MSIAEQVDELERAGDGYRHAIAELTRMNEMLVRERDCWREKWEKADGLRDEWMDKAESLEAERDQWKERAEGAEKKVADLEKKLRLEIDRANNTWAERDGYYEETKKLNARIAELERELIDAMAEVGTLKQCAKMDAAEINLERQQSKSHGLEAVLEELREELRGEGIPGSIHVDRYGIHVSVYCVEGLHHTESVQSFHDIPAAMAELVVMHYPDSAFARRRKPAEQTPAIPKTPWMMRLPHDEDPNAVVADADGNIIARVPGSLVELWQNIIAAVNAYKQADPTPNHSETPNSSTDPVADLLKRYPGEWSYDLHTLRLRAGNSERFCAQVPPSIGVPLAELGNRYRRIVDAVDRYFANGCSSNNAFADEVTRIVYPKEAAK